VHGVLLVHIISTFPVYFDIAAPRNVIEYVVVGSRNRT